jgi:hypothetical protein
MSNNSTRNQRLIAPELLKGHYRESIIAFAYLEYPKKRTHFDQAVAVVRSLASKKWRYLQNTWLKISNPTPEQIEIHDLIIKWLDDTNLKVIPNAESSVWQAVFAYSTDGDETLKRVLAGIPVETWINPVLTPGPGFNPPIDEMPEPPNPTYEPELESRAEYIQRFEQYAQTAEAWLQKRGRIHCPDRPSFERHLKWFAWSLIESLSLRDIESRANLQGLETTHSGVSRGLKQFAEILGVELKK